VAFADEDDRRGVLLGAAVAAPDAVVLGAVALGAVALGAVALGAVVLPAVVPGADAVGLAVASVLFTAGALAAGARVPPPGSAGCTWSAPARRASAAKVVNETVPSKSRSSCAQYRACRPQEVAWATARAIIPDDEVST
jgi:hypothetical protein